MSSFSNLKKAIQEADDPRIAEYGKLVAEKKDLEGRLKARGKNDKYAQNKLSEVLRRMKQIASQLDALGIKWRTPWNT